MGATTLNSEGNVTTDCFTCIQCTALRACPRAYRISLIFARLLNDAANIRKTGIRSDYWIADHYSPQTTAETYLGLLRPGRLKGSLRTSPINMAFVWIIVFPVRKTDPIWFRDCSRAGTDTESDLRQDCRCTEAANPENTQKNNFGPQIGDCLRLRALQQQTRSSLAVMAATNNGEKSPQDFAKLSNNLACARLPQDFIMPTPPHSAESRQCLCLYRRDAAQP